MSKRKEAKPIPPAIPWIRSVPPGRQKIRYHVPDPDRVNGPVTVIKPPLHDDKTETYPREP
jgi:hypothetical protein